MQEMNGRGKKVVGTKPVDMELIYAALITYPDDSEAQNFMLENGYEVSASKMAVFRRGTTMPTSPYFEPYLKRREQLAPRLEAKLAEDMLSEASMATEAIGFAVERTYQMLAKGEVADPARAARDLSQIRTQAIDKRLALQGRPTEIVQNRSVDELVNALVGMKVAERVDTKADVESTAIEETADAGR